MKKFFIYFLLSISFPALSSAALPFVTDDAIISNKNELLIEAFSEFWSLPKKSNTPSTTLFGQYFGLSYGATKNLEVTAGGLMAYDFKDNSVSFMNPIFQLKSVLLKTKSPEIPDFAVSAGYANRNGRGQYYDTASNLYLLGIATSRFFEERLIVHINSGPKASFDLDTRENFYRLHLGIAFDAAINHKKTLRIIAETYNGTPNSPRDSQGFFHSYQTGFRFIKSPDLSFHILYGSQPTFAGYDAANKMTYRRTNWVQFGIRKSLDDFLKF